MAEPAECSFQEEDSDTESTCSSISSHQFSSRSCFDDPPHDEPAMMEEWDARREREGNFAIMDFIIFVFLSAVMIFVSYVVQSIFIGIFLVRTRIESQISNIQSSALLWKQWVGAISRLAMENLTNTMQQSAIRVIAKPATEKLMGTMRQALLEGSETSVNLNKWSAGYLDALRPIAKLANPKSAALAIFILCFGLVLAWCISGLATNFRLLPRWFIVHSLVFCSSSFLLDAFFLAKYISVNSFWMLELLNWYWYISVWLYCEAVQAGGLTTWRGIPIPWKGTDPRLWIYPFEFLETRRWIDVRVGGVRLKGRKVALWKMYKLWYYGNILFCVANIVAIPILNSDTGEVVDGFSDPVFGWTTKNEAFDVFGVLDSSRQCWMYEYE